MRTKRIGDVWLASIEINGVIEVFTADSRSQVTLIALKALEEVSR